MKKHLHVLLVVLGISANISAQVFWTEAFENSCTSGCPAAGSNTGNGPWTLTNNNPPFDGCGSVPTSNMWYVSCAENGNAATQCGTGCSGDESLHIGSTTLGDQGASYDAGGGCDILGGFWAGTNTDVRIESPTIDCSSRSGITLAFNYIEGGEGAIDNAILYYFDGSTWSVLFDLGKTSCCGGTCNGTRQGRWAAYSISLPASANFNPNVKIGFRWTNDDNSSGIDPSFAVDDITLSGAAGGNSIATGTINGSPFCSCAAVSVPFTSTGTFNAGNIYTAQLSDATGSFASPTNIGTLASTANSGSISATIPCGTPTGSAYRIRVISSNPATTGTNNGSNLTINNTVTPSVSIAASPAGSICAGTSVTFTATPTNGGTPTYQWQLNGSDIGGATGSTFSSSALVNGEQINVIMTSTATCASPATATSNTLTLTVTPTVTPSVTITASPSGTICSGTSVTFTAAPTNGGAPTYQWQLNGTDIGGATSATYSTSGLINGDMISVNMTSTAICASPAIVTSNTITLTVDPTVLPTVNITASPAGAICEGTSVTFTATPTNGGTPSYQWQLNGSDIAGETSFSYTSSTLSNSDIISVNMTSNASCASPLTVASNSINMTVNSVVAPSVSIIPSPAGAICEGTSVTFIATPTNGGTPSYQWQLNGSDIAGETSSSYNSNTLVNGDLVSVTMTSNAACVSPVNATSNTITMTVNPVVIPSVSIAVTPAGSICAGTSVTFSATQINGGTPTYQWQLNGSDIAGATSSTYSSSSLTNGDQIKVFMSSSAICASPLLVMSNTITMAVDPILIPSVMIASSPVGAVCEGTSVTFNATPINGGTPSYQWQLNGSDIAGATSSSYTSTTLANGDNISVTMTSTANCASPSSINSNTISVVVNPLITPTVSISASPAGTICEGTSVTFSASPVNGGTPTYQWQLNGSDIVGASSSSYSSSSLINGDIINVIMTSNANCASPSNVNSNNITMVVSPNLMASVNIVASPSNTICTGELVNFNATTINGGTPTFQWQLNGSDIAGETASSYSSNTLNNGDQISVIMTSTANCASPSIVASNTLTMVVSNSVVPQVNIVATPSGSICSGTSVTFDATAINGGIPTYQWQLNGVDIAGATSSSYTSASLNNGDQLSVNMMSSASCASPSSVTSNTITMIVISTSNSLSFVEICEESIPYTWNGNNYDSTGIYSITLVNVTGCDSIASLDLTIHPNTTSSEFVIICANNLPYVWLGNNYSNTGTFFDTIPNHLGCDSILTLNLTVRQNPDVGINVAPSTTVCVGNSVTLTGSGADSYTWSGGITNNVAFFPTIGSQTYTVTGTDGSGCTNTATQNIVAVDCSGINNESEDALKIFPNPTSGIIYILKTDGELNSKMELFNSLGEVILSRNVVAGKNESYVLDISTLNAGIYFLNLNEKKVRIVKQ